MGAALEQSLWYQESVQEGLVLDDRYELFRLIGEGATSAVWEAVDRKTGDHVAVKAVSLDQAGWRAEVRDRFQQEVRLLELARHRHLVGVRAQGETDDGYLFLVLDLLHGETLADRIARPPKLEWREASRLALQIAEGLAALHARGIVHRDLKPANVFIDKSTPQAEPVAKIIDLGISKARAAAVDPVLYATLTATGQVLGTPEYMSYEQALGERDIDMTSDIWALGVVLYEMLAGRRPFEAPNINAVLAAIRKGSVPSLAELGKGVPPSIIAVVDRCLSRDKSQRFHDGTALCRALEAAIAEGERADIARKQRTIVLSALSVLLTVGALLLFAARARTPRGVLVIEPPSARGSSAASASPARREVPPLPSDEPKPSVSDKPPVPEAKSAPPPSASVKALRPVTNINSAGF